MIRKKKYGRDVTWEHHIMELKKGRSQRQF